MRRVSFNEMKEIIRKHSRIPADFNPDGFFHAEYDATFKNTAIGDGMAKSLVLKPGITFNYLKKYLREETILEIDLADNPHVVFLFCLSGQTEVLSSFHDMKINFTKGQANFFILPPTQIIHHIPANTEYTLLNVFMNKERFESLLMAYEENLPEDIVKALSHDNGSFFLRYDTTYHSTMVANAVLYPPFKGISRQFYIESKIHELIALQINEVLRQVRPVNKEVKVNPTDQEKLRQCRTILEQHIENPPSLNELAKKVGLNTHKLKNGFKILYGSSVFNYLKELRMAMAIDLLNKHTVSEVSEMLGFANIGHFSNTFFKNYGYRPTEIHNTP